MLHDRTECAVQILFDAAAHRRWGMCPEWCDVQGSLDASAEELALCSSIADFRNCIHTSEPAWSSHDVRGFTDPLILQLFDVRYCLLLPAIMFANDLLDLLCMPLQKLQRWKEHMLVRNVCVSQL